MDVQVTFNSKVFRTTLSQCIEFMSGRIATESVVLMHNTLKAGGEYEYDYHHPAGRVHITVEPLIHAHS